MPTIPQFILVELPSFRLKTLTGQPITLSSKHMALFSSLYQYVRSGLATSSITTSTGGLDGGYGSNDPFYGGYTDPTMAAAPTASMMPEMSASLVFAGGEPDIWTATAAAGPPPLHAEENMLMTYYQSFDAPGAYPIVDAILMSSKPCSSCLPYFQQSGKHLSLVPGSGSGSSGSGNTDSRRSTSTSASFRGRYTPRSDRHYTPIFHLPSSSSRGGGGGGGPAGGINNNTRNQEFWLEMASMWSTTIPGAVVSTPELARGQMYYLLQGSAWYAVNEQETMSDVEVAEAVAAQGVSLAYWVGR